MIEVKSLNSASWTTLPSPSTMSVSRYDLDSEAGSGRNQKGKMFRDRVAVKTKLTMKWAGLTSEQTALILNSAITDQFFNCRYFDPKANALTIITCYVGDRASDVYTAFDGDYMYSSFTMNFIEQ